MRLAPVDSLVANVRFEVFHAKKVQNLVDLREQAAVDFVLVAKIIVGDEESDFDVRAGNELLGLASKEKSGSPFEVGAFGKL